MRQNNKVFKRDMLAQMKIMKKKLKEKDSLICGQNDEIKELRNRNYELEQGYLDIDTLPPRRKVVLKIQAISIVSIESEIIPLLESMSIQPMKIEPLFIPLPLPVTKLPEVHERPSKKMKLEDADISDFVKIVKYTGSTKSKILWKDLLRRINYTKNTRIIANLKEAIRKRYNVKGKLVNNKGKAGNKYAKAWNVCPKKQMTILLGFEYI